MCPRSECSPLGLTLLPGEGGLFLRTGLGNIFRMKGMILALWNGAFEQSFYISEVDLFIDAAKRNSHAAGSRPRRSADAMDVTFRFARHIIIDDMCDAGDIDSS